MTINELNRMGRAVWELRETAKAAMECGDDAEQTTSWDNWSTAADILADATRELATEMHIGIVEFCSNLDVHARDAFREPAI